MDAHTYAQESVLPGAMQAMNRSICCMTPVWGGPKAHDEPVEQLYVAMLFDVYTLGELAYNQRGYPHLRASPNRSAMNQCIA